MEGSSAKDKLLEIPIRASLWRVVLLGGADRRVTITVIGSCMVLVLLSRFSLWPCVTAVVLATLGQLIGVKLASADQQMIDIYLRHIGYCRVYPARADICSQKRRPNSSIPKV